MNNQSIISNYGKDLTLSLDSSQQYDLTIEHLSKIDVVLDNSEYYDITIDEDILNLKLDSSEYFDLFLCGDNKDYIIDYKNIEKLFPYILTEDMFIFPQKIIIY